MNMPDGAGRAPQGLLAPDEEIVESFRADRMTYLRDNAWMAALAMAAGWLLLWAAGNPYPWTGPIGGLAAIAARGWYMASEELANRWDLTDRRLRGPAGRDIPLERIRKVNRLASSVQVVTDGGDKHLIKYQADARAVQARLRRAARAAGAQGAS